MWISTGTRTLLLELFDSIIDEIKDVKLEN
jgi:hypothetical protein